jgi:hypothetical protein
LPGSSRSHTSQCRYPCSPESSQFQKRSLFLSLSYLPVQVQSRLAGVQSISRAIIIPLPSLTYRSRSSHGSMGSSRSHTWQCQYLCSPGSNQSQTQSSSLSSAYLPVQVQSRLAGVQSISPVT